MASVPAAPPVPPGAGPETAADGPRRAGPRMTVRPLTATYRLQFSRDFTFDDASALVPYLDRLGVSHLYASPIFRARPGSTHGYDVVDHDAINPELGGEEGLRRLLDALADARLGLVVDIVPNHAGIGGTDNARWRDVLEFGRRSRNARFFDIDWNAGPLVLPVLDAPLDRVLAAGRMRIAVDRDGGRLLLAIDDQRLPLRPKTVVDVLAAADRPALAEAGAAIADLEGQRVTAAARRERRAALARLLADPDLAAAVEAAAARADLAAVVAEQHYRPMFWRDGANRLNYRRFFDITDLAGLRVEEPAVFDAVHRLPLALVKEGCLQGLRIDHVDGLADPAAYCRQLRERVGDGVTIHVEKILGPGEALRPWPVDGTTGYETLNLVNGLFVEPAGYALFLRRLAESGIDGTPEERTREAKREVLERSFSAELDVLSRLGADLSRRTGHPVRLGTMREILIALIAALPVYRTYVTATAGDEDRRVLEAAAVAARRALTRGAKRALATLVAILEEGAVDEEAATFIRRFQQLSGPAMAKGYEDTELYRAIGLASVNEVGSHLTRPTVAVDEFHRAAAATAARGLHGLVPLSTHDTKRGADTRARLNVLSEMAETWLAASERWHAAHGNLRQTVGGAGTEAPDRVDEDLVYQTLAGVWPIAADRVEAYLVKALREAKRRTTWIDPDETYERAVVGFARRLVEGPEGAAFRDELEHLLATLTPAGRRNGLAQTVLQLTIPGVPDVYRGSEFWEHVLVDPDNRRPVDWKRRIDALSASPPADLAGDEEGRTKQRAIAALLGLRRDIPELFADGSYEPLPVAGAADVLAFMRRRGGSVLVVAVPVRALPPRRGDVVLDLGAGEPMRWRAVVGDGEIRQEGRLLRLDQAGLPAAALAAPRT